VPVEQLPVGRTPSQWLLTEGLDFALQDAPIRSVGDLASLQPKPGDRVTIDNRQATFVPIDPRFARREGGITLNNGLQPRDKATLLAYTVLDVPKKTLVKLNAPFTQNRARAGSARRSLHRAPPGCTTQTRPLPDACGRPAANQVVDASDRLRGGQCRGGPPARGAGAEDEVGARIRETRLRGKR